MDDNQTQSVPAVTPPVPVEPIVKPVEVRGFPLINVILGLVVIMLIAVVGFLAWQNMELQKEISGMKVTASPIATADPTAGWRQITNKYWSFRAPTNLYYILCEPNEDDIMFDYSITADQKVECGFDGLRLISIVRSMSILPTPTSLPVIPTADPSSLVGEAANLYTQVSDVKNLLVGGKPATYQTETQHGGQFPGAYIKVYVVDGSVTYVFTLSDVSKKDIFDQVLSTFKFN